MKDTEKILNSEMPIEGTRSTQNTKEKLHRKAPLKMVGVKTTIEIIWYRHTEISSEVPQKVKNRATTRSNCTICQNNLASYYRVT